MNAIPFVHTLAVACFLSAVTSSHVLAQQGSALPFDRGVKIEVSTSKPADIKGGDFDDKSQKIIVKVKFTSTDIRQAYDGYTATVSAFGQCVIERDTHKVLMQEQIPLSLAPLKSVEHTCAPVKTQFDKTGARFGYFYDGWIIVVKDPAGKVVHVKSTSPAMEKLPDKADKLAKDKCYNRSLDPVDDPDPRAPRKSS